MQVKKTDNEIILVITKGENVIETITNFCQHESINNAYFRGIGAIAWLECGFYALEEQKYYFTEYSTMLEVVSLTGNVIQKEGAPFVHMHGVFTDTTNNAFGGRVKEMRVGVTLEVILTPLSSTLSREYDQKIGLFLINCGN